MEERQTLRQATKLRPEEIDPEFGRPYNDLGVYLTQRAKLDEAIPGLQKARQARRCEPRVVPFDEPAADLPSAEALVGGPSVSSKSPCG